MSPDSERRGVRGGQAEFPKPVAWETEAKRVLRAELARAGVTYKGLVLRLERIGVVDNETAIASRISRGKYSFAFFLQCMRALGVTEVDLRDRRER